LPFISVGKNIEPPIKGLQGLRTWKDVNHVYVDNVQIEHVIELDTDLGYVIKYGMHKDQFMLLDCTHEIVKEKIYGNVTFTWRSE
jgi:hypothetical protein